MGFPTPMRIAIVHGRFLRFSCLPGNETWSLGALSCVAWHRFAILFQGFSFIFALSNFVLESVAFFDESVSVAWTDGIRSDLHWWSDANNILTGCRSLPLFWTNLSGPTRRIRIEPSVLTSCCLRPVVVLGDLSVGHSPAIRTIHLGLLNFQYPPAKSSVWVFHRQPIISGVCYQTGWYSLVTTESAGSTPTPVGGESFDSSPSPVCRGHSQLGWLLSFVTQQVVGFRVDPSAGVVNQLVHRWPANSNLFAIARYHRMPAYFALLAGPASSDTDALSFMLKSSGIYLPPSTWFDRSSTFSGVDDLRGHSSGVWCP